MTKSGKHCGERRNCWFSAISSFVNYDFKKTSATVASESIYMRERVKCEEVSRKGKHINIVLLSKKSNIYFSFEGSIYKFWWTLRE